MREPEQAGARSPLHGAAGHLMRPWRSHSSRNQPPCDSTRGKPSRRALQHRGGSVDEVTEKRREEFGGQNPEQHVLQWLPASGLRLITVCGRIRTGAYKPCTSGRCDARAIFRSLLATCLLWAISRHQWPADRGIVTFRKPASPVSRFSTSNSRKYLSSVLIGILPHMKV